MQVNRGKVHKYLGMILDYSIVGRVKITMFDYIDEIIVGFDKSYPMGGSTKSIYEPAIIVRVDE